MKVIYAIFVFLIICFVFDSEPIFAQEGKTNGVKLRSQFISDAAFFTTKFSRKNFESLAGSAELRLAIENIPFFKLNSIHFEPYVKTKLNLSTRRFPRGDSFIYGLGMQSYILENFKAPKLLKGLRFYSEALRLEHIKEDTESSWSENSDWRIGFDLWSTHGLDNNSDIFWSEVWANIGYIDTNFYIKDYQTFVFQSAIKLGAKFEVTKKYLIMPYIPIELSINEHSFFWENYLRWGGGVRMMPWVDSPKSVLKTVKIFAEYLTQSVNFKDDIEPGKPNNDFKIGIQVSYDWWNQ